MFRKFTTLPVPENAERRVRDGVNEAKINRDGKPTWVRLNASGRAVVQGPFWYAKINGKPIKLARDKTAAEQILAQKRRHFERVEAGLELPEPVDGETDLETLLRMYDTEKRDAGIVEKYRKQMDARLRRILADLKVTRCNQIPRLSTAKIEEQISRTYLGLHGAPGARGKLKRVGASRQTRWLNAVALRGFCKWLVDKKHIGIAPPIPLAKRLHVRRGAVTRDQLDALVAVASETMSVFYRVAFSTLARVGALCALRIRDVDFDLDKEGRPTGGIISFLAKHSKTKKAHAVPIAPMALWHLWVMIRKLENDGHGPEKIIFGYKKNSISAVFARDAKKAKIETNTPDGKITPHSLRHGGATYLLRNGVSPVIVQKLGGWESMAVLLEHYSHVIPVDADESLKRLMR